MNDYIVLIDESGKPYIAHANEDSSGGSSKSKGFGKGRGWRENVKYIAKWGEGAKAKYFYTKEQLEAFDREHEFLKEHLELGKEVLWLTKEQPNYRDEVIGNSWFLKTLFVYFFLNIL